MKRYIFFLLLLTFINSLTSQSKTLSLNILNDTIYYLKKEGKINDFFGLINDSIFIDTTLKFELVNNSKHNYFLLLENNHNNIVLAHPINTGDDIKKLKPEHNFHISTVLFDDNNSIISSSGSFITLDFGHINKNSVDSFLQEEQNIIKQEIFIRSKDKLFLDFKLIIPYFEDLHYKNSYRFSKEKKYYLKFYLYHNSKLIKKKLSKKEIKKLKRNNFKIYNDFCITLKNVVLMQKE